MTESTTPRVAISSLTFSDGTDVPISPNDVVLVVGPNNAGKSAGLRAIRDKLQNSAHISPVLQSLQIQRSGSVDEFSSWLLDWTVRQMESPPENPIYQALGHALHRSQAHSEWQRADNVLGGLARWFWT